MQRTLAVTLILWGAAGLGRAGVDLPATPAGESATAAAAETAALTEPATSSPPPLVFDGLGLDEFRGTGSIAAALSAAAAPTEEPAFGLPVDVVVRGPTGRDRLSDPLRAELRSGIPGLDLAAGLQADSGIVSDGPAKWTGAVRFSNAHPDGRDLLELKTSLDRRSRDGIIGLELGPRIERRLRRGTVVFIDGKAQAQARRAAENGPWILPGLAEGQGLGSVGVNASTGLSR